MAAMSTNSGQEQGAATAMTQALLWWLDSLGPDRVLCHMTATCVDGVLNPSSLHFLISKTGLTGFTVNWRHL